MPNPNTAPALQRLTLAALLMLAVALPAQAQWKWKDASGKTQYSDLPPPSGTPEKDILQRPPGQKLQVVVVPTGGAAATASAPASAARAASAPTKAELDQQAKQKQQEQELLAKQKEEDRRVAALKRDNCSRAQEYLRMLDGGGRLSRPNEKGENIPMDDRQRAEQQQRTRAVIASDCR
jgi:hypothetical protein